jgi:hypothetical protein
MPFPWQKRARPSHFVWGGIQEGVSGLQKTISVYALRVFKGLDDEVAMFIPLCKLLG